MEKFNFMFEDKNSYEENKQCLTEENYRPKIIKLHHVYKNIEEIERDANDFPIPRNDLENYVTVAPERNVKDFTIDFEKITGNKELANDEKGSLDKLYHQRIDIRAYVNTVTTVVFDLNYIFNEYPELALMFMNIKYNIYYTDKYKDNSDALVKDCYEMVMDNHYRDLIHSINESTYHLNMNKDNEPTKYIDKNGKEKIRKNSNGSDLQVTDQVNKVIIESAIAYRTICSLVCEYSATTPYNLDQKNAIFIKLHTMIINSYGRSFDVDIENKLHKIVQPRIKSTLYSDQYIWNYLKNISIDDKTLTYDITQDIIKSIINKMITNKRCISLFHVVIRNKIEFTFKVKYAVEYKPIKVSNNDDDIDENDKMSFIFQHRNNEVEQIADELTIHEYIQNNLSKYNITGDDIKKFNSCVRTLNEFQFGLLSSYFVKDFDIKGANPVSCKILLMIMALQLKETNKYKYLWKILLSKRIGEEVRHRNMNSARPSKAVVSSKTYNEIMDEFTFVGSLLGKRNVIMDYSSISNYTFQMYTGEIIKDIDRNLFIEEIANLVSSL